MLFMRAMVWEVYVCDVVGTAHTPVLAVLAGMAVMCCPEQFGRYLSMMVLLSWDTCKLNLRGLLAFDFRWVRLVVLEN